MNKLVGFPAGQLSRNSLERLLKSSGFGLENLQLDSAIVCVLDPDLRIIYCNDAWDKFAASNAGLDATAKAVLGVPVLDAISDLLKPFYAAGFGNVQKAGAIWEHEYECSSPESFRAFRMRVFPLSNSYLLVEHSLRTE